MSGPVTVAVTQADREAAAEYHGKVGSTPPAIIFIRSRHSDQDSLVQAFARHRQQAEAASAAQVAELREALGDALHGLSAMLLLTGALDEDKPHAAYEKVVARFQALARATAPDAGGV